MKDSANNTYQSLEERIVQCNKEIEDLQKRIDEAIQKCERFKEYIKDVEKKFNAIITVMVGVTATAVTYFLLEVV